RLGFGMQGSVYVLDSITQSSNQGFIQHPLQLSGPSVIKFPHRLRTQESPLPGAEAATREEGATYRLLTEFEKTGLDEVEANPEYPQKTYWTRGHLPVIPVWGAQTTTRGTFLIKPLIRGWNLKEIYQHYGSAMPPEMEAALKTVYEALRVLDKKWPQLIQKGTREGVLSGARRTLDINPRNLMWIPKAEVDSLKAAGVPIEREGFFLIEFAFAETEMPQISSWQAFKEEFDRALVALK
ncbi:MAG: hypothetical protein K2X47_15785, partial [Bdellovibrionales bacterium]|nr:hypothetical protein [Bdellovibrionales bacterium]